MRILLDTNVLARAAADRSGPAREVLTMALQDENILCLSPFLLSELSRVLRYERLRRLHGMDDDLIDQFLIELQRSGIEVLTDVEFLRQWKQA